MSCAARSMSAGARSNRCPAIRKRPIPGVYLPVRLRSSARPPGRRLDRGKLASEMSEAMQALYAGDPARGRALLPPDDKLDVFEAAAFGRLDRLAAVLAADPAGASARSSDGFTALHLAIFGCQPEAAQLLIEKGAG